MKLSALLSAGVLTGSLLLSPLARAEQKVAVVNVQRAIASTEEGLRAQATLKKMFDAKQQELDKKQKDLARQREDIEKQSKVLSKEALAKRAEEWQRQASELQMVFMEYNKEIEKKQKEMTEPVFEKMMAVVRRIAAAENIDIVVDQSAVAFVRSDLDLTDRCIQLYNGGGNVPAAPAPKK